MPGSELVQSLLRGLDALLLVAQAEDGMRLGELASRLDLKTSTIHNLLRTLAARGLVDKRHDNRYVLGPMVAKLARVQHNRSLLRRAGEALERLHRDLPDCILTFSESSGGQVRCRLRISPDQPNLLQRNLDLSFSPYTNASGLVLQAYADHELRDQIRRQSPFHEQAAHLWGTVETLDRFLAETRRQGYATPNFAGQTTWLIATPVLDGENRLLGILGANLLSTPNPSAAQRQSVINHLRAAAANLGTPPTSRIHPS